MSAAGGELYQGLARYQWWMRRLRGSRDGEDLEMHKRLRAPAAGAQGPGVDDAWHAWLWQRLQTKATPRVADLGCGFGASVLHFAQRHPGWFVGFGDCRYQLARATAQAAKLGLAERCEFRPHHHGEVLAGPFDAILAVETLLHADDLGSALRGVAAGLLPGARLVAMEDVARGVSDDPAVAELVIRWRLRRLFTLADWTAAAGAAGLRQLEFHDLTAQVMPRDVATLTRAERNLRRLRAVLPSRRARAVVDAFLGGIALERLYLNGVMLYRCAVFGREVAA